MAAKLSAPSSACDCKCPLLNSSCFNGGSSVSRQFVNYPLHLFARGVKLWKGKSGKSFSSSKVKAFEVANEERTSNTTSWDEKPFEILPSGKRVYLDEQDVVTFLHPPKELIPLDPSSYNPAVYLWKKISEIPDERRHRLLQLLNPRSIWKKWPLFGPNASDIRALVFFFSRKDLVKPFDMWCRLISAAWEVAGTRFDDAKLAKRSSSTLLAGENDSLLLEFWNCHKSGGPMPLALISYLKKALFRKDGKIYGRLIGGSLLAQIATSFRPLYFTVKQVQEVMPTEQPCDLAYEFGDGLLDLHDCPEGFPTPAKHPWPFNDQIVIYVRHVGPGVMVGQAWQEGLVLEQVPKKLCSEILMVKDYPAS